MKKKSKNWNPWSLEKLQECQNTTGISFITSPNILSLASRDFGRLIEAWPMGIAYPKTTQNIADLLSFASNNDLQFTVRSAGYSQGGQTLPVRGSATLDCSQMNHVESPILKDQVLICQPGAKWHQVIAASAPHGLIPKVMPLFPDLSVGGVLSVGGIGNNSHLYGCTSGNVRELEVVTGEGCIKTCSPIKEPELFEAALCGLGRCAIITKATLELRPYKPKVVTYYLLYTEYESWFSDLRLLSHNPACDYLEAFCVPSLQGLCQQDNAWKPLPLWFYNLQVSFEYQSSSDLTDQENIINSLKHWRILHKQSSNTVDFLGRYGSRVQNMKENGSWDLSHPWFECILPEKLLWKIFPELLKRLPISLGDGLGYRLFYIGENIPPSFIKPSLVEPAIIFAALPTSVSNESLSSVLASLRETHEWLTSLGGKRYLSGWLDSNTNFSWQAHYGSYYEKWKKMKEVYDPNNVLHSVFLQMAA